MLTSDDIHRQIKSTVKVYDEIVTGLTAQNVALEAALAAVRTENIALKAQVETLTKASANTVAEHPSL